MTTAKKPTPKPNRTAAGTRRRGQAASAARRPAASLRGEFGITRKAFARMTGLSERTLATWETGRDVGEAARRAVTAAERLLRALAEVIRKEAIAGWLEVPNEGFGGLKPVEVLERGEADRLWRMVYFLNSGTAS